MVALTIVVEKLKNDNLKIYKSVKTEPKKQKGRGIRHNQATKISKTILKARNIGRLFHNISTNFKPPNMEMHKPRT